MKDGENKSYKEVFIMSEGKGLEKEKKTFFLRAGVCFENRDGSWNLFLDALPVNGKLHIRDPLPKTDRVGPPPRPAGEPFGLPRELVQ